LATRIIGRNFEVTVRAQGGVISWADRPVRWMTGKPLARVLALAKRWDWKIEAGELERVELEKAGLGDNGGSQRP
jgi:hypothetical protein